MASLYMLIPIALGVMIVVVIAFIYTVRSGQYDDMEGPAYRILMDDDDPRIPGRRPNPPPDTAKQAKQTSEALSEKSSY